MAAELRFVVIMEVVGNGEPLDHSSSIVARLILIRYVKAPGDPAADEHNRRRDDQEQRRVAG